MCHVRTVLNEGPRRRRKSSAQQWAKLRFVESTINGNVRPNGKRLVDFEQELLSMGFEQDPVKQWKNEEADLSYLINLPLSRLTVEEVQKLRNQVDNTRNKFGRVVQTSWQDSWIADLKALQRVGPLEKGSYY
ncbi:hypothetical protein ANCDUO_14883 [Ancylostoma duodenale]|uniref:DNA topoisomerase (ATP-hydrolyzing) n=1 Tax=Ancylostoma duodenale TaxID=51022 RepID=A0A0C2CYQ9_9BILA|nr:hypothetical protein ANCDUO_14883 [Ancylostoma duodenale]